jgi:hypothetical protein
VAGHQGTWCRPSQADADERAAAAAEEQANRYVPSWRSTHDQGDRHLLANGSDETAYDANEQEPQDTAQGDHRADADP